MNIVRPVIEWIDKRFPIKEVWDKHAAQYYAPKNLNFWYFFGVLSALVLINQVLTGIWLTMYYTPTAKDAFASVEYIMRDVHYGWLLRYMHSVGASAFFIVIYLHMYRGIMYGSYKAPRELVWIIGMFLYFFLLMEAATGYVLPWGQMSYWATKVLISIFTVLPFVGKSLSVWLQGDYNISGVTLHRFFSFHIILIPLIILFLAWLHIIALHKVGSNNPDGNDIYKVKDSMGKPLDAIPFHPYYTYKDGMGIVVFFIAFACALFYAPTMGGFFLESANFSPANPLMTPEHITPPWYMSPYYSILRAIPDKFIGVILAAAAIALLFVLPWLDRSAVRSIRYRGIWSHIGLTVFVVSFLVLGFLGTGPITPIRIFVSRIFTILYFLFFITLPIYTRYEENKPVPERVKYP